MLATIITSDKRQGYMSRFGSSPDFDVALERCLTEAFQGIGSSETVQDLRPLTFGGPVGTKDPVREMDKSSYLSFYSEYRNGSGCLPKSMFMSDAKPDYKSAFLDVYHSNRNALKHMLDCFHMNGARVFVRDSSHLGFPSFRIYVPGFTEISRLNADIPIDSYELRRELGRDMLRLKRHSPKKIRSMAAKFERLLSCPVVGFESLNFLPGLIEILLGIWIKSPNDFNEICSSRDKLLAILFHRAGDPKKAARYFKAHLESHPDEAASYTTCCLAYFALKADGLGQARILDSLASFFGREPAKEVVSDLKDPANALRYYQLPECGDCSGCEIKEACLYLPWKKVTSAYQELVGKNPINQGSLKSIFSEL